MPCSSGRDREKRLNVFVHLDAERHPRPGPRRRSPQRKPASRRDRWPGLPVAIKDVHDYRAFPPLATDRMQNRPPYDATVIARLKAADAVV